jgi:hypothetical protein
MKPITRSASKRYEQAARQAAHQEINASSSDNSHQRASLDLIREATQKLDPPMRRLTRSATRQIRERQGSDASILAVPTLPLERSDSQGYRSRQDVQASMSATPTFPLERSDSQGYRSRQDLHDSMPSAATFPLERTDSQGYRSRQDLHDSMPSAATFPLERTDSQRQGFPMPPITYVDAQRREFPMPPITYVDAQRREFPMPPITYVDAQRQGFPMPPITYVDAQRQGFPMPPITYVDAQRPEASFSGFPKLPMEHIASQKQDSSIKPLTRSASSLRYEQVRRQLDASPSDPHTTPMKRRSIPKKRNSMPSMKRSDSLRYEQVRRQLDASPSDPHTTPMKRSHSLRYEKVRQQLGVSPSDPHTTLMKRSHSLQYEQVRRRLDASSSDSYQPASLDLVQEQAHSKMVADAHKEGDGRPKLFWAQQHRTDKGNRVGKVWNEGLPLTTNAEDGYVDPIKWREDLRREFKEIDEGTMFIKADPHPGYNCHGLTFTNGDGGRLSAADVVTILKDHEYKPIVSNRGSWIKTPVPGDVIIFRSEDTSTADGIIHSGFVTRVEGNKIYIENKWGEQGVMEHLIESTPEEFGQDWTIYHTSRPNGRRVAKDPTSRAPDISRLPTFVAPVFPR